MKYSIKLITTLFILLSSGSLFAAQGDIGPVYLEKVIVIALASGGHSAGNLEIQIKDSFVVPQGLNCNNTYITTLKSTDADKRLYSLLLLAQSTKQPVHLRITDDPAYTAFHGRCSLVWGAIAQ
ncbi:hypothetical protein ACFQNF_13175 [Iodobacter arcticus]|uniref:Uncharacterized protein n=1 Tax=Iodobacter arcticus TaxID=590593 RepID=A0ABW2R0T7_9NEIS